MHADLIREHLKEAFKDKNMDKGEAVTKNPLTNTNILIDINEDNISTLDCEETFKLYKVLKEALDDDWKNYDY